MPQLCRWRGRRCDLRRESLRHRGREVLLVDDVVAGQCAAVSAVVSRLLGALMVSTKVVGQSHWFNRLRIDDQEYDFDLTGDQYGFNAVQLAEADRLYPGTRVRAYDDLNAETIRRARLLATKAGLSEVAASF